MLLLRNGEIVPDHYQTIADGEALENFDGARIIVSWPRLREDFGALRNREGFLGVAFPVSAEPLELEPFLAFLSLIGLEFASFTDGRAYSLARIIRTQLHFSGELRATGDVLPDQVAFMRQVGFDAFAIRDEQNSLDTWQRAATSISLTYQQGFVPQKGYAPAEIFAQRRQQQS